MLEDQVEESGDREDRLYMFKPQKSKAKTNFNELSGSCWD